MLADVDQRLLGHPVRRHPLGRRQLEVGVAGDLPAQPRVLEHERRGLPQRGRQVGPQRRRVQVEEQVAQPGGRVVHGRVRPLQARPRRGSAPASRRRTCPRRRSTAASAWTESSCTSAAIRARSSSWACTSRLSSHLRCSASPAIARSASTSSLVSRCTVASATGSWVSGSRIRKLATVTGMGRPAPRSHSSDCPPSARRHHSRAFDLLEERRLASVRKSAYVMVLRSRSGRPISRGPRG